MLSMIRNLQLRCLEYIARIKCLVCSYSVLQHVWISDNRSFSWCRVNEEHRVANHGLSEWLLIVQLGRRLLGRGEVEFSVLSSSWLPHRWLLIFALIGNSTKVYCIALATRKNWKSFKNWLNLDRIFSLNILLVQFSEFGMEI